MDAVHREHGHLLGVHICHAGHLSLRLGPYGLHLCEGCSGRDEIIYKNYYNLSFAVGTEKGLVVPVLRNADELSFADIEKNIKEISEKARDGKLTIEDLQGGTFTISNGGVYGSMLSTPILNLPQSGVLGMHNIVERPVVVDGEIKIRPIMYLALSYDHRIIDGKESISFLKMVKENLEDPRRLFLDI